MNVNKSNKVMITGVAGLIGSHLAEKLLQEGCEVYAFDIVDISQSNNLINCVHNPNFKYFKGDFSE